MNKTLRIVTVVLVSLTLILLLLMTATFFFTCYQLGKYGITDIHYQGVSWKNKSFRVKKISFRLYDNPIQASDLRVGFSNAKAGSNSGYHFTINSLVLTANNNIVKKLTGLGYIVGPVVFNNITGRINIDGKNALIFIDVKDAGLTLGDTDQRHLHRQVLRQWHLQVPLNGNNQPLMSQVDFASVRLFSANADTPVYALDINRMKATLTRTNQLQLSVDKIKPLWAASEQLPSVQVIQDILIKTDLMQPQKKLNIEIQHASLGVPDFPSQAPAQSINDNIKKILTTAPIAIHWLATPFMSTLTIRDLNFAHDIKQGVLRYSGAENLLTLTSPAFNAEIQVFQDKGNQSVHGYFKDSNKNHLSCQINMMQADNTLESSLCKVEISDANGIGRQLGMTNRLQVFIKGKSVIKVVRVNEALYHVSLQMPKQIMAKAKEKNTGWENFIIKAEPDIQLVVNTRNGVMTLREPVKINLQETLGKKNLGLKVKQAACYRQSYGCQLKGDFGFDIDRYTSHDKAVSNLKMKGNLNVIYSGRDTAITVDKLNIKAKKIDYSNLTLSSLFVAANQFSLKGDQEKGGYALSIDGLKTQATLSLTSEQFKTAIHGSVIKGRLTTDERLNLLSAQGEYVIDLKRAAYKNIDFPELMISSHVSSRDKKIYTNSKLTNYNKKHLAQITTVSNQDFTEHTVNIWHNSLSFSRSHSLRKNYFETVPVDIDIVGGELSYHATLFASNEGGLSGVVDINMDKLTGSYDGYLFNNLSSKGIFELSPKGIKLKKRVNVTADKVSINGIELDNLSSAFTIDSSKSLYQLFDTKVMAYKGMFSTKGFKTQSLSHIAPFSINVNNLDVANILQSFHYNDVIMTGTLNGVIPLSIDDYTPIVNNARLYSVATHGVLKYREGGRIAQAIGGTNDKSMVFLADILSNYHYDALQIDADYSKSGIFNTLLKFTGRNPDFQDGKDVNINLRIEDNISKLLQTINAVDSNNIETYLQDKLAR